MDDVALLWVDGKYRSIYYNLTLWLCVCVLLKCLGIARSVLCQNKGDKIQQITSNINRLGGHTTLLSLLMLVFNLQHHRVQATGDVFCLKIAQFFVSKRSISCAQIWSKKNGFDPCVVNSIDKNKRAAAIIQLMAAENYSLKDQIGQPLDLYWSKNGINKSKEEVNNTQQ